MKKIFQSVGAVSKSSSVRGETSREISFIEKHSYVDWDLENVFVWIQQLGFGEEENTVIKAFRENEIDGFVLKEMRYIEAKKYFKRLEIDDLKILWAFLQQLREKKKFDVNWTTVFKKVVGMARSMVPDFAFSLQKCAKLGSTFSKEEDFYEKYFLFFVNHYESVYKLKKEIVQLRRSGETNKMNKLKEVQEKNREFSVKKFRKMFHHPGAHEREMDYYFRISNLVRKTEIRVPVTLILTEPLRKGEDDTFKKRFYFKSPRRAGADIHGEDMALFDKGLRFGVIVSGIQVGPWYLEWNKSGLVIPKYASLGIRYLQGNRGGIHLYEFGEEIELEKLSKSICKACVRWNTRMKFGKSLNEHEGNCQNFVDEILEELEVPNEKMPEKNETVAPIVHNLRKNGRTDMTYYPSKYVRETLKIKEKRIKFETHVELDNFVRPFFENFRFEFGDSDFHVLKSFDRVFWLRNLGDPDNVKFQPAMNGHRVICSFGDPRETHAFV